MAIIAKQNTQVKTKYFWEDFTDEQLLGLRFCDLDLSLKNSFCEPLIKQVEKELSEKNISIKPHFWLSDEWFTPDGVSGVALPFYLIHPKLAALERSFVGYAEGETKDWCLKLLRHEIGHVVDNAYELRRKRNRQLLFGKASVTYPNHYSYRPYSRRFVRNLEDGYAQSHPAEDFAETFAVWLDPKSNWQKRYKNWPALRKLNYLDNLMAEIRGTEPKLRSKILIDPIAAIRKTLKRHYLEKQTRLGIIAENRFWDVGLSRIFSNSQKYSNNPPAETFFSKFQSDLRREVARKSGYPQYMIQKILDSLMRRSRKLNLKVVQKDMTTQKYICYYLSRRVTDFVSEGLHLIAL